MQHDPVLAPSLGARHLVTRSAGEPRANGILARARDMVALTKPRITASVVFTALGGYWLGCRNFGIDPVASPSRLAMLLGGTALVVGGANALNMYLERDTDALMTRTAKRPLPEGRLRPSVALAVGLCLSVASLPLLSLGVHPVTGFLATIALLSYVMLYTPLKRVSPASLLVGAVPGALPPLLGWSAARGTVDLPGLFLFGVMFFWQIPHFLAIATFRKEEYGRAGLKVLPVVAGDRVTRHHIVRYLAALVMTSLLLFPSGLGGVAYRVTALVLGAVFFGVGAYGLRKDAGVRWARMLFLTSMVYMTGVFGALMIG